MPKTSKPDLTQIAASLRPLAVPIDKMRPDPANARRHPPENVAAIRASLRRYGQRKPIIVNRRTGTIEAGNAAWEAARAEGWMHLAVVYVADDPTTAAGFAIADNRTAELAEWDERALLATLEQLRTVGELGMVGFEAADLTALARQLTPEADDGFNVEAALAAAPDLAVPIARGQIWRLGDHRIACGDATSAEDMARLMGGRRAALIWTDPPYGVSYQARGRRRAAPIVGDEKRLDELEGLLTAALKLMVGYAELHAAFYIWHASLTREHFARSLKAAGLVEQANGYLVWAKPMVMGHTDYGSAYEPCFYAARAGETPAYYGDRSQENVWTVAVGAAGDGHRAVMLGPGLLITDGDGHQLALSGKAPARKLRPLQLRSGEMLAVEDGLPGQTTVWRLGREKAMAHPTQKPVELAARAIANSSRPGEIALDPFLGSGTCLIAAEYAGRLCYGMDIEPKWIAVTIARWEALIGQSAICEGA